MKNHKHFLLVSGILLILTSRALSIETGMINGRVLDESGEGLPGVKIEAKSPSLQGLRTVLSSKDGGFQFPLLPVGTYTLTFRLEGFSPVIQKAVIVRLGKTTDCKVILKVSEIKEEILVTAPSPLIDKTSTDTSYHLTGEDLERLPSQNRTVVDVVKFTPGVTGVRVNTRYGVATEGQPSFRGEGEEGNNWVIDGLNVSGIRLRNAGMHINFDSIDEIQVISDPFSPEFASAYGGIINMVTKSGSNDFHGEFSLVFQDKSLQAEKKPQLSAIKEPDSFSNSNIFFNLGGPLVKDKLWFFVSNNYFTDIQRTKDQTIDYLSIPAGKMTSHNNNLFAKLSYAPTSYHNISLTTMLHKSLGLQGGTGVPDLYEEKTFSDFIFRVNYKGILNSSTFVEAGLGHLKRDSFIQPQDKELGPAQYFIEDLAQNIHNSYGNVTDDQKRLDFSLKFTKYVETETFGRHEFILGLEYYSFSSQFAVDFTGEQEDLFPGNGFDAGTKYYFSSWAPGRIQPTFFYEYGVFDFVNSANGTGFYFKDKITWNRFTLMAGFRSQSQICLDNAGEKLWSWGFSDFLSPRLSLAVDLTGDGANVLKLGWGRFSDLITTMPLGLLNSGAGLSFRNYRWQGPSNPSESQLHNPSNWQFENEQKSQPFEIAEGIEPNFLSRALVEFDKRLGREWALKARYIWTNAKNLLEVLAVFDPVTQYKFLYDNFEYKRRNYKGVEVELNGKIGPSFFLNASYSYSSAKGTNPGQTETGSWSQEEASTNYLGFFGNHIYVPDRPELKDIKEYVDWALGGLGGRGIGDEGWYGKLPYSVDHTVKVNAMLFAPFGLSFSAAFEWISGYYWEKLGYVPFFGVYFSFPEGRGSRETPAHAYLDLGVEKKFPLKVLPLAQNASLTLRLDVFNLLNSQMPISYVKEDIPLFGEIWGRQQPRQARLLIGLKW